MQTADLLVGVGVVDAGNFLDGFEKSWRPFVQIVQIFRLQGVLILGGTEAAADAEVLHGLHEKRSAGNSCGFAADASDGVVQAA